MAAAQVAAALGVDSRTGLTANEARGALGWNTLVYAAVELSKGLN